MNTSKQWNLDGNCSECLRENYCRKQCNANKDLMYSSIGLMFTRKILQNLRSKKESKEII